MQPKEVTLASLSNLRPGESGLIREMRPTKTNLRHRLMEMGVLTGSRIELIRVAPFGDPLEVRVCGYRLSLRKVEAESVLVSKDPP